MTFRVGQKVVCVSKFVDARQRGEVYPSVGGIYTIRAIIDGSFLLEELRNPPFYPHGDPPYEALFVMWRFRPLIERKTDIGFAHEILRKVARKDRVSA